MGSDHDGPPGCRPAMLREGIPAGVWGQPELPSTTASSSGGGLFSLMIPASGNHRVVEVARIELASAKSSEETHPQA